MVFRRGERVWPVRLCALLLTIGCGCQAQENAPPTPPTGPMYTLHVYQNLVQVPVMVLDGRNAMQRGLVAEDFTIRLDQGPKFHPLHVHVQGDDPLSVAVVIDATHALQPAMLKSFSQAIAGLPDMLAGERDEVVLYAVDCALVRGTGRSHPPTVADLEAELTGVLANKDLHRGPQSGTGCDDTRPLWDAVATAAGQIRSASGRRIVLVLSDGEDGRSANSWRRVKEYVDRYSVSVFGIRSGPPPGLGQRFIRVSHGTRLVQMNEDPFVLLCEGTGGLVLDANEATVGPALERIIRMVRERYILEFQRPRNPTAGVHSIEVRVDDRKAIVRTGGVSVALEDPTLAKDPSTIRSDDSHAPVMGSRRALSASH